MHIEGRTREGGGTSPRWTTAARPSSTGYTAELEPGHSGRAKPAKATELQAPCVGLFFGAGAGVFGICVLKMFLFKLIFFYIFILF